MGSPSKASKFGFGSESAVAIFIYNLRLVAVGHELRTPPFSALVAQTASFIKFSKSGVALD